MSKVEYELRVLQMLNDRGTYTILNVDRGCYCTKVIFSNSVGVVTSIALDYYHSDVFFYNNIELISVNFKTLLQIKEVEV